MYKNKIGIILIILGISAISYGAFFDNSRINKQKYDSKQINESSGNTKSVTAVTDLVKNENSSSLNTENRVNSKYFDSSANLKIGENDFELNFNDGENLYNVLNRLKLESRIDFSGREYDGLGYFIEQVNELKPDKGKSLIFFVNNKKSDVGVSGYKLKKDDFVEFRIEDTY